MKQIAWKKLSPGGFAKYGTYANMINPVGPKLGAEPIEFFRDMVQSSSGSSTVASFGVCRVVKRPFVLDVSEYHDTCCEIVLPLDGDVLMHVAPAGAGEGVSLRPGGGLPGAPGDALLPEARRLAPRPVRAGARTW